MADAGDDEERDLAAGDFSSWLAGMLEAIRGGRDSEVPCGGCTACCTSSQFVHIGPDEADTLAHIPAELLSPAPLSPPGHVLLGYDERGHCPMLIENQCSIYEHRPRTCRAYDCRIFPAAGLQIEDGDQAEIARQARRWRFALPTQEDRDRHGAVLAAVAFLREHPDVLPEGISPANMTRLAALAVEVHELFLRRDATGRTAAADPDPEAVRGAILSRRTAEAGPTPRRLSAAPRRRRR